MDQIYAGLDEIFRDLFGDDAIRLNPATTAADIAEWDSVNHINILVAVEVRFGIKFSTAEIEALRNVGDMAALIARKQNRPAGS
ncbi:MAG TPA: acyl carrier protein [Acetobacteraceae bacterium]|jgi:acyl carrier protein|nr:acyl carrier protein [Acetobacteraceae bacterium]